MPCTCKSRSSKRREDTRNLSKGSEVKDFKRLNGGTLTVVTFKMMS